VREVFNYNFGSSEGGKEWEWTPLRSHGELPEGGDIVTEPLMIGGGTSLGEVRKGTFGREGGVVFVLLPGRSCRRGQ